MSDDRNFAFIIHPIDAKADVARKYPLLGRALTERQIDFLCTFWPPVYLSQIGGIQSRNTDASLNGWFIAAPYTPRRMLELPERMVYRKIVEAGRLAERLGARILGLGAFTAVVGDAGVTIARQLDIPVTTGDAYAVSISVQAVMEAGKQMGIVPADATAAVIGATGSIGSASSELLADHVGELILIGRRQDALDTVRERCESRHASVTTSTDLNDMHCADLVLSMTSSVGEIITPEHLKPGSVVCDVALPRDVSRAVVERRNDVLVIEGGMVDVPGVVNFNFDFGYPPGKAYACMAETMALALEGRFEDYTLGRDIEIARVREIETIASKHGFRLSGLRSFEREVTSQQIAAVRERAAGTRHVWNPAIP